MFSTFGKEGREGWGLLLHVHAPRKREREKGETLFSSRSTLLVVDELTYLEHYQIPQSCRREGGGYVCARYVRRLEEKRWNRSLLYAISESLDFFGLDFIVFATKSSQRNNGGNQGNIMKLLKCIGFWIVCY